jgi:hypothetical protein
MLTINYLLPSFCKQFSSQSKSALAVEQEMAKVKLFYHIIGDFVEAYCLFTN